VEQKKFKTIEEAVEWLENQMIKAVVMEQHLLQLNYIDEAVDKSDLKDAIELIDYIKAKK
jgi:hypothetical protein